MSSKGVYKITEDFEQAIADYTGAPYVIAVDNASNALFLALYYEHYISKTIKGDTITIPSRTYPSVPCEILHAGLKVNFKPVEGKTLKGPYQLEGSNVWDSALCFTYNMFLPKTLMCVSFTGGLKSMKFGCKAGAILCDSEEAAKWFKQARFSGRKEVPYMEDDLSMTGWNFYLNVELAARGLVLMTGFYKNGKPIENEDIEITYPDLSLSEAYKKIPENYEIIEQYKFICKLADVPSLIIENPFMFFPGKNITKEDLEWARKEVKRLRPDES